MLKSEDVSSGSPGYVNTIMIVQRCKIVLIFYSYVLHFGQKISSPSKYSTLEYSYT